MRHLANKFYHNQGPGIANIVSGIDNSFTFNHFLNSQTHVLFYGWIKFGGLRKGRLTIESENENSSKKITLETIYNDTYKQSFISKDTPIVTFESSTTKKTYFLDFDTPCPINRWLHFYIATNSNNQNYYFAINGCQAKLNIVEEPGSFTPPLEEGFTTFKLESFFNEADLAANAESEWANIFLPMGGNYVRSIPSNVFEKTYFNEEGLIDLKFPARGGQAYLASQGVFNQNNELTVKRGDLDRGVDLQGEMESRTRYNIGFVPESKQNTVLFANDANNTNYESLTPILNGDPAKGMLAGWFHISETTNLQYFNITEIDSNNDYTLYRVFQGSPVILIHDKAGVRTTLSLNNPVQSNGNWIFLMLYFDFTPTTPTGNYIINGESSASLIAGTGVASEIAGVWDRRLVFTRKGASLGQIAWYNQSVIDANPSIDFTDLETLKDGFVNSVTGKPKDGGLDGLNFISGVQPSFYLNPAKGVGNLSTNQLFIAGSTEDFVALGGASSKEAVEYETNPDICYKF